MTDDFSKKRSELIGSQKWNGFLGIVGDARYHTKAGVSSLYSDVFFLTDMDEDELAEIPDFILSDTLQKDLTSTVVVCAMGLKETKYLPASTVTGGQMGALPEGEYDGAVLRDWKDFEITNFEGQPLYDREVLEAAVSAGEPELGAALWLIVRDICDSGGFLSLDWYRARIVYEYFRERPTSNESAYLIGELFKELCVKETYEGDLATYFRSLADAREARSKGTSATKEKAERLRSYCVELFVTLFKEKGPRLLLAPDETKAEELARAALRARPDDFQRGGKPYRKEWFLRNVIEDRRLEIAEAIEALS